MRYGFKVSQRLRLALIGSVLLTLGVIAHTVSAGTISLVGIGIATLLGFGCAIPLSRGALKRVPLVLTIFGTELLIHMALSVAPHSAGHVSAGGFMPSATMLFGHGVAAILAMSAIVFLDSLYAAWVRMVAAVIGEVYIAVIQKVEIDTVSTGSGTEFTQEYLVTTDVSRGPPLCARTVYALCA
jgi:hypothetical protein